MPRRTTRSAKWRPAENQVSGFSDKHMTSKQANLLRELMSRKKFMEFTEENPTIQDANDLLKSFTKNRILGAKERIF